MTTTTAEPTVTITSTPPTLNIHQRMLNVMRQVSYVQKENKPGMRYAVVSHDSVTALIRPSLVENGITYYPAGMDIEQVGNRTQVKLRTRFTNADEPSDFIDVISVGYGVDDQDKGPGKAVSYAVKYALLKAFGLETGMDSDLDQNSKHVAAPVAKSTLSLLSTPMQGQAAVEYKNMSVAERITYWSDEWEKCTLEAAFDAMVNTFRSVEPDGSQVRTALAADYRKNKERFIKVAK